MQLGMVGLGRMGANMVRRLMRAGHECVVYDTKSEAVEALVREGATGASSLEELAAHLDRPRTVWLMVPAGVVDKALESLEPRLQRDDVVVDGGNSYYVDDMRRAERLAGRGVHFVDAGTSGGVWGLEAGYCLMIGGDGDAVKRLDPIFRDLAPGRAAAPPTKPDAVPGTAEEGYLHCGPSGAGHFVKMVHNGIEYGVMAAYAEGLNVLERADIGREERAADAESTPLRNPERYRFSFDLPAVAEVWRRGSVIRSWLLDLTASALREDNRLSRFSGRVSDSGEGRWTVLAAVETGAPAPVLSTALYERFSSRGEDDFAHRLLSAMRYQFGGHEERPAGD